MRHPTELRFGDDVEPGYLAETTRGEGHDGTSYVMTVRRSLATRGEDLAAVIAYHLPSINYGKMASADDAEAFGAALLGVDEDTYYGRVCALADEVA